MVSIITLNYNRTITTRDLLLSLRKVTYPAVEIIVVDNASADKSFLQLKEEFPEINLIPSVTNLGFSGGNNAGMRAANGDLLLLINNDVEVTPGFLEPMVEVFEKHPDAAMVSPKIVYYQRGDRIQYAGAKRINPWTGRGRKNGYLEIDNGQFDFVRKTELVHGACLMISRKAVEKVGLLNETYFIYYEEHDWAEHAKRKGFKLFYTGTSKIFHKESITMGKESPFQTYYMTRNRLLYLRRNVRYPAFITSFLIFACLAVPKKIFWFILTGNLDNLEAFMKGLLWHFKGMKE